VQKIFETRPLHLIDMKENKALNWGLFAGLSLIWGSSFRLMKEGMVALTPYQVAAIRMVSAGLVLLPFAFRAIRAIPREKRITVLWSGLLGNFFAAFLFCLAETRIDSALAGILNALTPLFAVLVAVAVYGTRIPFRQWAGVVLGFVGLCLLFLANGIPELTHIGYSSLVILATLFYGLNVNLVSRKLQGLNSLNIASAAFCFLLIPSIIVLGATGYFSLDFSDERVLTSTGAAFVLGAMGTALASVLFYQLVKRSGVVFSSMVTYIIPFVAIAWGMLAGENVTLLQFACMGIILAGVYITNKT